MTPKKQVVKNEEPFLNTVARKLGYAAGALTNVAQGLTDNLSALPQAAATKVRSTAKTVTDSIGRRQQSQKKKHRTARKGNTRKTAVARRGKPAAKKSAGRVKAVTRKKK
jgi:hypothetical protein